MAQNQNQSKALVLSTPAELNKYLQGAKGVVQAALPKHLNPDRMLRVALTCFSTTPKLRECTAESILASIVVASQIGLEPGVQGQGYLIPYYDSRKGVSICTFVPGWQGLVGLLNNSGRATAWTGAVFQGDQFEFELGSHPHLKHVPGEHAGDPSKLTAVYACGQVNGAIHPVIECWPISRVWKHRDKFNKVGDRHYSFVHPEMYARKVVLLQVLKYMPRSIELSNAMTAAHAAEEGRTVAVDGGVVIDVEGATGAEQGNVGEASGTSGTTAIENAAGTTKKKEEPKQDPAPENNGGPSAAELETSIKARLSKLSKGTKDLIGVLMSKQWLKDACKFSDLTPEMLLRIDEGWEELEEALAPKG